MERKKNSARAPGKNGIVTAATIKLAITVGKSIGELYENWVEGTVWYEVFGFSSLDEPIPPDSVYTCLPWEAELV